MLYPFIERSYSYLNIQSSRQTASLCLERTIRVVSSADTLLHTNQILPIIQAAVDAISKCLSPWLPATITLGSFLDLLDPAQLWRRGRGRGSGWRSAVSWLLQRVRVASWVIAVVNSQPFLFLYRDRGSCEPVLHLLFCFLARFLGKFEFSG